MCGGWVQTLRGVATPRRGGPGCLLLGYVLWTQRKPWRKRMDERVSGGPVPGVDVVL